MVRMVRIVRIVGHGSAEGMCMLTPIELDLFVRLWSSVSAHQVMTSEYIRVRLRVNYGFCVEQRSSSETL